MSYCPVQEPEQLVQLEQFLITPTDMYVCFTTVMVVTACITDVFLLFSHICQLASMCIPFNTWLRCPASVNTPNDISIIAAIFAVYTVMSDTQNVLHKVMILANNDCIIQQQLSPLCVTCVIKWSYCICGVYKLNLFLNAFCPTHYRVW